MTTIDSSEGKIIRKSMKILLRFIYVYLASASVAIAGNQITITFDDIPGQGELLVSNGYKGFQWSNFYASDLQTDSHTNGGQNSTISPPNVAFNGFGNPANFSSSEAFDLDSAYLTAVWNDGLQLEVQGFVGSTLTYDNIYTLTTASPQLINFNYLGVDEVNFISSGGTHHAAYTGGSGTQFAMDNLTVTVPEPSNLALIGMGLAIPLFIRRRKTNTAY